MNEIRNSLDNKQFQFMTYKYICTNDSFVMVGKGCDSFLRLGG